MSILHFSVVRVTEHPQRGTKAASVVLQWNNAAPEGEESSSLEVSEGTVVQFCLPMGVDGVKKKDLGSTEVGVLLVHSTLRRPSAPWC